MTPPIDDGSKKTDVTQKQKKMQGLPPPLTAEKYQNTKCGGMQATGFEVSI